MERQRKRLNLLENLKHLAATIKSKEVRAAEEPEERVKEEKLVVVAEVPVVVAAVVAVLVPALLRLEEVAAVLVVKEVAELEREVAELEREVAEEEVVVNAVKEEAKDVKRTVSALRVELMEEEVEERVADVENVVKEKSVLKEANVVNVLRAVHHEALVVIERATSSIVLRMLKEMLQVPPTEASAESVEIVNLVASTVENANDETTTMPPPPKEERRQLRKQWNIRQRIKLL